MRHKDWKKPPHHAAKSPKNSHTSPAAIIRQERAAEALDLRKQGLTYARIGARMGVCESAAFHLVDGAMQAITRERAIGVLQMELDRLDEMMAAVYPQACGGDAGAIRNVLKIMERRAKLLGLDAPAKAAEPSQPTFNPESKPTELERILN